MTTKGQKDEEKCVKDMHTTYRSLLGSINWLQSRTPFQACYQFSRCASAAASPTIGDCKALNKLCKQIVNDPMELNFCHHNVQWLSSCLNGGKRIQGTQEDH